MKRRSGIFWFGAMGMVLLAGIVFLFRAPDEPQYGDKSLTEWLDDLQLSGAHLEMDGIRLVIPSATPAEVDAATALRAMGTNAGPTLIRMLRAHDSVWQRKLIELSRTQSLVKLRLKSATQKQFIALHALYELGPAAVPALTEIVADIYVSEEMRRYSVLMLGRAGRESWPALPVLLPLVGHTNKQMRNAALQALGELGPISEWSVALNGRTNRPFRPVGRELNDADGLSELARQAVQVITTALATNSSAAATLMKWEPDFTKRAILTLNYSVAPSPRTGAAVSLGYDGARPELAVPVLAGHLNDTNATVRSACADALGKFNKQATSALPPLRELFNDSQAGVRAAATNAVSQIDPEYQLSPAPQR